MKVQDVPKHSFVTFQGEWGVLNYGVLDRWYGGKIKLNHDDEVEMLLSEPKSYSLRLPR